jgi:deoxyribodipyrimidine photo-lyase
MKPIRSTGQEKCAAPKARSGFPSVRATKPIIAWFRQDLRLGDNPALVFAVKSGQPVICLYVLDDETSGDWKMGGASRWWLHHSLTALGAALEKKGGGLILRQGDAAKIIRTVAKETGADAIVWNRCYEPFAVERDDKLKAELTAAGIAVESFNGALLAEPWEIKTGGGTPFRVYTPFWKALRAQIAPGTPLQAPHKLSFHRGVKSETLKEWKLLPKKPDWSKGFDWTPGEKAAHDTLYGFLDDIADYGTARDIPGKDGTSRLSPHLHFGEITPRQVWHAVRSHSRAPGAEKFLGEIGWREFNHQLLFHHPHLPDRAYDERFTKLKWRQSEKDFTAWTRGLTGVPIVDAGMRQLWQTGWMHNRVRMIVASFLVKHLLIDWRRGERWFWDTLVDADLANNAANWQWVAGSGADAAPFFRIFNPILQGRKFDPAGAYVRRFVPELAQVPDKFIHRPWELAQPPAGYPAPIVDLAKGRDRALAAFRALPRR